MTSLRDRILENITARLQTLSGWTVSRRNPGSDLGNGAAKQVWVTDSGEQVIRTDSMTVQKDLGVTLLVWLRMEDSPAALGRNPDRYLSESLVDLEAVLFAPPAIDLAEQLLLDGWSPFPPQGEHDENLARAVVRLRARYRHNIGDPATFSPMVVA